MSWGCYKHEMDRGSDAWQATVAEITPKDCKPWGRDGEVCPACHAELLTEVQRLREALIEHGVCPDCGSNHGCHECYGLDIR